MIAISMFPTIINSNSFMNIKFLYVSDMTPEEMNKPSIKNHFKNYIFIKYELKDPDTLSISLINPDILEEAIKDKRLKGIGGVEEVVNTESGLGKRIYHAITITDSTENIVKFIIESDLDELFEEPGVFKRLGK